MIKQALVVLGTVAMFVALPVSSLAQAQATGAPLRVDHYVRTRSTVPAMNGQIANLYVRERVRPEVALRGNLTDRVVVMIHGAGTPAEVAYDVPYADYSWMAYLADAGFDVFSMDVTGYGRSTRPGPMDDPCNLSPEQQKEFVPGLLPAPCVASSARELSTIQTDWDDIEAVVNYVRALRHVERVDLIAWSLGGARAGGYTAAHQAKVRRLVLLAPAGGGTNAPAAPAAPFGTQSRAQFRANWDRQVGCSDQYDPKASDSVWSEMLLSDPVGATWGDGVRRAPNLTPRAGAWDAAVAARVTVPVLLVSGVHDKQVDPQRVRQLHAAFGSADKVFIDLGCSSHNAMWERNHLLLFDASRQWLTTGSVNGTKNGALRLGYPGTSEPRTN